MVDKKQQCKWVIYILTNPSFPDYVKIWYATDIEKRLKQLNHSETIPFAFRVYAIYETERELTDKEVHKIIDALNPDLRAVETFDWKKRTKEFYAMTKEEAYALFESIAKISGTESRLKKMKPTWHEKIDEQISKDVINTRKGKNFSFQSCNIPIGEKVTFKNKNIEAVVVSDNKVEYNWETMTLTWLATKLLGKKSSKWIPWPDYFCYKGEKINDIRRRLWLINF